MITLSEITEAFKTASSEEKQEFLSLILPNLKETQAEFEIAKRIKGGFL